MEKSSSEINMSASAFQVSITRSRNICTTTIFLQKDNHLFIQMIDVHMINDVCKNMHRELREDINLSAHFLSGFLGEKLCHMTTLLLTFDCL